MATLTLIDGNSLLFRAYYGVHGRLTRADGTPTGAVFGFFNMVLPLLAAAAPDDMFVCVFDASRQTFRQNIYPEYKANRRETPADLIAQADIIKNGMCAMGVPVLCVPGVEADDVIATLARENCNRANQTRIVTSDKDLMQLVDDCVYLYDGMKARDIRRADVVEKFGVGPEHVIDVQSLMGDASDNVPGVPGIGPKKAAELINRFGSLDALYENLNAVENERVRNLLRDNREMAYVSQQLVRLKTDVDLSGLELRPFIFNTATAIEFIRTDVESPSLISKIEKLFPTADSPRVADDIPVDIAAQSDNFPAPTETKMTYETIRDVDALRKFLGRVRDTLAIDTETTGLDTMTDKIVGISIAADATHGAYIPVRHRAGGGDLFAPMQIAPNQLTIDAVYRELWPVLSNTKILKIGHNLKFDFHIMANEGWDVDKIRPFDDTMLMSYALYGARHGHGLDELAKTYLGHENISFESLFPPKTRSADMRFDTLEIDAAAPYAAEDATVCRALYDDMRKKMAADEKLMRLYEMCDRPLMPILFGMERAGVAVNRAGLAQLSGVFHEQLSQLEREIWNDAGHEFNIASPKQLAVVLFDELGITPKSKKRSTDAETLGEMADAHPIVDKILQWRSIAKLAGTYADALPHQIGPDGRIHTTYLQTSTNTGRLSSRDPNLQNIPIKTALGEEIRKCFVASPGRVLIAADYSQIQLRLLADVADIKTFKETFHNDADIHEQTARRIFNIAADAPVPREMRRIAKTVNFSIIYGISSFGLAGQLNISRTDAARIIDTYMAGLPEINAYIKNTQEFAMAHSCVYTPWGRRIELPDVNNSRMRAYAMRAAVNAPIQGFEADLMRRAMVEIDEKIMRVYADKIRMIMQVHDEMIFECDADAADDMARQIKYAMENVAQLSVPLRAEYTIGDKWKK